MFKPPLWALGPLLVSACTLFAPDFEKPHLSVAGIEMIDGNFFQQNFRVHLKVQNPNARELPINGLNADLKVGGELLASGVSNRAFTVPAFGETEFDLLVSANMAIGVIKLLGKPDRQLDSIDYDIAGKVSIDLPFMGALPFHETGSFPLKGKPAAAGG